jgi:hypothetical protein
MKKLYLFFAVILSLILAQSGFGVAKFFPRYGCYGGASGDLDDSDDTRLSVANLNDGDIAIVHDENEPDCNGTWVYHTPSTDAEDPPFRVRPDDYGAGGVNGVWEKQPNYAYIQLIGPQLVGAGVAAGIDTTETNETLGQVLFDASTDEATNYVEYRLEVPRLIDPNVDIVAWFKFRLSGADTGDHDYRISMASVANSGDYTGSVGNTISLSYTADGSGADGDVETAGGDTLTGWAAALTAGELWVIRVARDGNDGANDSSTVDSYSGVLTIRYGR